MFLKNKNIIFKIRRSKVTDYAALMGSSYYDLSNTHPQIGTFLSEKCLIIFCLLSASTPVLVVKRAILLRQFF